jgi:hypothetical protein
MIGYTVKKNMRKVDTVFCTVPVPYRTDLILNAFKAPSWISFPDFTNVRTLCLLFRSGIQPLLPDDFGDEALAGIKFGEEFTNR